MFQLFRLITEIQQQLNQQGTDIVALREEICFKKKCFYKARAQFLKAVSGRRLLHVMPDDDDNE